MREGSKSITTTDAAFEFSNVSRYFAELSPQPMVAVQGTAYLVRHVNAAFERLAGKTRSELIGRPFDVAVPEGVANSCKAMFDHVYRTGKPETLAEQKHGDTTNVYWSYAVWAIMGPDDRPVGLIAQITDSTETAFFRAQAAAMNEALMLSGIRQQELAEKAALAAELEAASRSKDQFMAVLGHELRNPLNPVLAIASVLKDDPRLDADTREQLEVIRRNAEMAARLIDDLLDVTRIKRGKLELKRHPLDLCPLLRQVSNDCLPDIELRELKLEVDLGSVPLWVDGDAGRLQQVFWNLLKNAIKFTHKGGKIAVRCRHDTGGYVETEVSDTGEGIEAELLPRLFDAFEQGGRKMTRQFGGLGLGLTISKAIAVIHGGNLSAHSAGKGQGATFVVRLPSLPAAAIPSIVTRDTKIPPAADALRQLSILLVEDHGDTARIMQRILTSKGHQVQIAPDVTTALKLAGVEPFTLLLSDLGLPDGSGLDLMRQLRAQGLTMPGIALSGYGQDSDFEASRAAGFMAHLVKPVSLAKLAEAIAKVVGKNEHV